MVVGMSVVGDGDMETNDGKECGVVVVTGSGDCWEVVEPSTVCVDGGSVVIVVSLLLLLLLLLVVEPFVVVVVVVVVLLL